VDITMPQLGETVTEGTITRWLKHVGDRVEADEPLFEVSTDKVDSEVPAPAAGYLSEIRVNEGETAAVGTVLAVMGETPGAAPAPEPAAAPAPEPAPAPAPAPAPPPAPTATPPLVPSAPLEPAPPAPSVTTPGVEPTPALAPAPPPPAVEPAVAPPPPAAPGSGAVTSPIVRRLLAEHGLDPSQVRATGDGGRITRADVLAAAAAKRAGAAPTPPVAPAPALTPAPPARPAAAAPPPAVPPTLAPAPAAPPAPSAAVSPPPVTSDEVVPFSNIRRRTAEHMVRSKATSAHVYTSMEVDFERVARVRADHQEEWKAREGFGLTYLPFVARALGAAVQQFPNVNASVGDDALIVHRAVNLGIAVDLDFEGLIAPVIQNADAKGVRLLAREIRDLADRARNKQLMPDEVLGGTFTITNPGPFGTLITLPIISQPQVAILSTDGVRKRPTVVVGPDGDDVIAIRHVGILALTWDHRAFDGAYAAAFLRSMQRNLEDRDWAAELH
jgi:2-oxoglutarate dehydrogenase E2 component (dihydrolipoamide succinyltransferase)